MVATGGWDVGPNILAIVVLVVGAINAYIAHSGNQVTKATNTVITKELQSNDGSTLRDATNRIESTLGTTPPLPQAQQVYIASDHPEDVSRNLETKGVQ